MKAVTMTIPILPNPKTRAGLSLLAYHGVALLVALTLLFKSIDAAPSVLPMIATSQIWAAVIWWSGSWLAPLLLKIPYQIRYWWLLGIIGSCQPVAALLVGHVVLQQKHVSLLIQDAPAVEAAMGFSLYGGVSSLVYILLLRLMIRRKPPAQ